MDHTYNNNNKWRLHAIFSDPRVWINRGSTMDQHGSTWIKRLQHAAVAHVSCVMAHVSCAVAHVSCAVAHVSCVRLMAHASDSWLMRHASHASSVPRVQRPTRPTRPTSIQSPPPVVGHDDNKAAAFSPCATLSDLRLLSYTAWGNRVVLPTPYSPTGAIIRITTAGGALGAPPAVATHTKKAGIMPALFLTD